MACICRAVCAEHVEAMLLWQNCHVEVAGIVASAAYSVSLSLLAAVPASPYVVYACWCTNVFSVTDCLLDTFLAVVRE